MKNGKEKARMTNEKEISPEEIQELMNLQGWEREHLAIELGMRASTVDKWMNGARDPGPAAIRLMKEWLARSRIGIPLHTAEPKDKVTA